MKTKIVWETNFISRNFVNDFGASLKNIIGGRLRTYENMLNQSIKEVTDSLTQKYPAVEDIKMQVTEFKNASICVVVYGVIKK